MVPALRLTLLVAGPAVLLLAAAHAQRQYAAGDGLVCVNAARDWNAFGATSTLQAAQDFLRRRVRPECRQLSARVRDHIAALERARNRDIHIASVGPRPEPPRARSTRPQRPHPPRAPASPPLTRDPHSATPPVSPPVEASLPAVRQPTDPAAYDIWEPNWFQVIERYPDLRQLYGRGSADLCTQCIVGESGYLGNCRVAGAAAADPAIRDGARRMISMIHVRRRDGASAAGASFRTPTHFGRLLPPPSGGYCRQPDSAFR